MTASHILPTRTTLLALLACLALVVVAAPAAQQAARDLALTYGSLPAAFERNEGQFAGDAQYVARNTDYAIALSPSDVKLSLGAGGLQSAVSLSLSGGNPDAATTPIGRREGHVNYFIGRDPANWLTHIPTYSAIMYESVYPGIDAVYYSAGRRLEYDFVVEPGADPSLIGLAFQGVDGLSLTTSGDLLLAVPRGDLVEKAPVVYQDIDGVRVSVDGGYVLADDGSVGFEIGPYDGTRTLVIDPVLEFSTYLGGSDRDFAHDLALGDDGEVYVTGQTRSPDFPAVNAVPTGLGDDIDAFVTKLSADGATVLYSTYFGGGSGEYGRAIDVDPSGYAYITGPASFTFPTTGGAYDTDFDGPTDAFVVKLDTDGVFMYSTLLGGSKNEDGYDIAVDALGQAHVTGYTDSQDFTPLIQGVEGGGEDAFVSKLSADGSALMYSFNYGGSDDDRGFGITLDGAGNAYFTGQTDSSDFHTSDGAYQSTFGGVRDAFVAKVNTIGTLIEYSTYLGGSANGGVDAGVAIAVDGAGNAYVTGNTISGDFPTASFQDEIGGQRDAFVTKLNSTGTSVLYSSFLGGSGVDQGSGIDVDESGAAYVTGWTACENDFPMIDVIPNGRGDDMDQFVAKVNPAGGALIYSSCLGGDEQDGGSGSGEPGGNQIVTDDDGCAYVASYTESTDFPTANAIQDDLAGEEDAFITKVCPSPPGTLWGDDDCDSDVDSVDALKTLQNIAALPFQQSDPCVPIGDATNVIFPASGVQLLWGDVDCDGDVDSVDALKLLQSIAALPFSQTPPCPEIESFVEVPALAQ